MYTNFNLKIKKITLILSEGTDLILIHTVLPSIVYPYNEGAKFRVDAAHGKGEKWIIENFGIEPEIIKA